MPNILGESFDPYVKEQISTRQFQLGLKQNNDLVNTYLVNRTPWIRLTSGINISEEKCNELGIPPAYQGNELARNYILFNGTNSEGNINRPKGGIVDSYSNPLSTPKQYGFNSAPDYGLTPMPFVESIKIVPKNRGSLRNAEIKIKCFNREQFNIIETLFMRIKYTFLLEWGHSVYFDNYGELITNHNNGIYQDFLTSTIPLPLFTTVESPPVDSNIIRIQEAIKTQRKNADGNYDAYLGWLKNFKWSLNSDYSYDISLTAVTHGDVIESLSVTSPVEMEPITGEDSSQGSSPLARTLKKIKNKLDSEDQIKLSVEDVKRIGQLSNTPYKSPNDIEAMERDAIKIDKWFFQKDHYYMRLGALIRIIESFFYKYDTSSGDPIPVNFFDTDIDKTFCSTIENLFSLDPRTCVIESELFLEYYPEYARSNPKDPRNTLKSIYLGRLNNLGFKGFLDYKNEKGELVGLPLNIYVNIDMVLDILDKNVDKEGNLPIFDFYKSIFSNIDKALGGITNLEFSYDEEANTYFILDKNITLSPGGEFEEAALINVGLLTPNQGSFVLDVSIESTISNQMGSMLAIGAQSNNTDVGSNSIAISRWNEGLTDRIIPTKVTPYEKPATEVFDETTGDVNDLGELLDRYLNFSLKEDDISRLYSIGKNYFTTERDLAVEKDEANARFFIPLSLNITLDGISGPKIYQKYTINDELLPQNYRNNIEFLIKGISHTIDNSGWRTSLESIGTPKPRQLVESTPPSKTLPFFPLIPGEISSPNVAPVNLDNVSTSPNSNFTTNEEVIGSTPVNTSNTPNANRLRNVLTQLGYLEKGNELSNRGDITPSMADYAISVFREIKRRLPNTSLTITAGNDQFHNPSRLGYVSSHSVGNGLDFVISPSDFNTLSLVEDILKQFVAGNRDQQASYINEYASPTRASTGDHFHLRIKGIDRGARANINNIYRQAEQGLIDPLPIT